MTKITDYPAPLIFVYLTGILWVFGLLVMRREWGSTQGGRNFRWVYLGMFVMCFLSIWISMIGAPPQ